MLPTAKVYPKGLITLTKEHIHIKMYTPSAMPFPYTHVPVEYIPFPQGEEHNPLKGVSPVFPALLETVH